MYYKNWPLEVTKDYAIYSFSISVLFGICWYVCGTDLPRIPQSYCTAFCRCMDQHGCSSYDRNCSVLSSVLGSGITGPKHKAF